MSLSSQTTFPATLLVQGILVASLAAGPPNAPHPMAPHVPPPQPAPITPLTCLPPSKGDEIGSRLFYLYYYRDAHRVAEILRGKVVEVPTDTHTRDLLEQTETDLINTAEKRAQAESKARTSQAAIDLAEVSQTSTNPLTSSSTTAATTARDDALANAADARSREESLRARRFELQAASDANRPLSIVAGDPQAIDPAARVTVSVVGEGTLHLYGPLNGIHRLARIIHEIDRPVGQVKVGLHSIQLELPSDQELERVHDMIDEQIRHARLLTQRSSELFRRAFYETVSSGSDLGTDLPLPTGIFCHHFMAEMKRQSDKATKKRTS